MIVTEVPAGPEAGERLLMLGPTVNATPLLASPPTVTTTFPELAPLGTTTTMLEALQLVELAAVPLKVTVLEPCDVPKFDPAMVTEAPTGPEAGLRLEMLGGTKTVKGAPLLARPLTVTTTLPVAAPLGTGTTMLVAFQLVGVAAVPLKMTVLEPCDAPKFDPAMVTEAPTGPEAGLRLEMLGGTKTAKGTPLLARPPTLTITFPVAAPLGTGTTMLVALQLVGAAAVPLKVTELVPCEAPKFVPVIVTEVPTGPDVGLRLVILGETSTVKGTPLLTSPLTVTTTFPVAAPLGTGTTMLVALQLVGVAAVPLKVTVLLPCVEVKFVPVMVIEVPARPEVGLMVVMLGAIAKLTALLANPDATTLTATLVNADRLLGTIATMLVLLQFVTAAAEEPNVTELVP